MAENQTQAPPPIQPPTNPPPAAAPPPPNPEAQARTWNMLCHLSALAACVGVPFGNILGPLIVWQIKKNEFPSVDVHGKAALNFQITVLLVCIAGMIASVVLSVIHLGWLISLLFPLVGLAALVCMVIAGIKANNGEDYKYPFSLELVK